MAATVSFRLNTPRKKDKAFDPERPYPIIVSYFNSGLQVKDLSTGERCRVADWTGTRLDRKAPRAAKVNKVLADLERDLLNIPYDFPGVNQDQEEKIVRARIKREVIPLMPTAAGEKKTIVQLWSEYLMSIKDTIEWRTFNSYSNSFQVCRRKGHNFKSFVQSKNIEDLTPDQFTITHYNLYHGYLKTNVKPNTVAKRLKHFKQFCSYVTGGLKIHFGFDPEKITYKETSGLKIALSEYELGSYAYADLPHDLQIIRDLVIIQCSTGLRISDHKRIDKNLRGDKIVIEAQKTGAKMEIYISPAVKEILEKYNYQLPVVNEQAYRLGIKEIHKKLFPNQTIQVREGNKFKDVFVHEEISSHDMVRTFITLSAQRGMPINDIAKITGKSVATLLKNYLVESQINANASMEKAWSRPLVLLKAAN